MWTVFNGTIVNSATVVIGSVIGVAVSSKLPDRYRDIVLTSLGLVTITLGIDSGVLKFAETVKEFAPQVRDGNTYGARIAIVVIGSLILGSILGTALRLHERIESAGGWIHRLFSKHDSLTFAEGFLTASVIFCVGPLTLLGCLRNGAYQNPDFLYVKSVLDGFCSIALASSLGWGVLASVATIILFQGGLSYLAFSVADPLDDLSLALMTVVGGIVLLATALMILDIKKVPVANMLPGVFLPPLFVWISKLYFPGLLLPAG